MALEDPVGMALKGDCRGFLHYFAHQSDEGLVAYRTANDDSAIHIAAAMENPQLIRQFLQRLTPKTRLEVLKQKDAFGNTGLHEAAVVENFEVASILVEFSSESRDAYKDLLEAKNGLGETAVYRAAALGKTKLLQILTEQLRDLRYHFRRDADDKTILHMAVLGHHFDTAIWLLRNDSSLAYERTRATADNLPSNKLNSLTCLELLALMPTAFESADPIKSRTNLFYYRLPTCLDDDCNYKQDLETDRTDNRIGRPKKRGGMSIWKMYIGIWRQVIEGCPRIKKIWKKQKMHENAVALVKMLVEIESKRSSSPQKAETTKQEISTSPTSPKISTISLGFGRGDDITARKVVDLSAEELVEVLGKDCTNKAVDDHVKATTDAKTLPFEDSNGISKTLFFAASNGITEILEEILQRNPQAILSNVNEKGQTILHVAIRRRQRNVFKLVTERVQLYVPKWAARIDEKGYTILHHVADMKHYRQGTHPGPVLQFQEELKWFERVKDMMPPHYAMHRDEKKNMTASDLFEVMHEDQLRKAQEWIKETSQSCSTLAILIATVVFAAAYTVPGGTNDKGFPNFLNSPLFYVFTVMDVASLSFSLSSVVMFLSILTSPRESSAFLGSLPGKLTIGFTLLFFSVLTSMITFSASLLLIIRLETKWTAALYAAAIFPVIVLALMQFPFYANFVANLKDHFPSMKKKKKETH